VVVSVAEWLKLLMGSDGSVKKMDVTGEAKLTIFDPDFAKVRVAIEKPIGKKEGFQMRFHPKLDKKAYAQGALGLKNDKGFSIGGENATVLVKWKMATSDESMIPFSINFWPSNEDGQTVCNVEYSVEKPGLVLKDVFIAIPCPSSEPPSVSNIDGDFEFNRRDKMMVWHIPEISEEHESGTLDFSVPELESSEFYPIQVSFNSETTYSGFKVTGVSSGDGGEAPFSFEQELSATKFVIVEDNDDMGDDE